MIKGMGIDSIELDRIARVFDEYKDRFLNRVFSPEEQSYALEHADPVPRLAARFAAKEACMKALGTGWNLGVRWRDIVVQNNELGKPELTLRGEAQNVMKRMSVDHIHLSLTHSKTHATAIVIFE
jgi:holo-[acyl-carrier protein] synthase